MATSVNSNDVQAKLGKFSTQNPRDLQNGLDAFAKRFPVSGRIVHALAQDFGGVMGLAERLEANGLWDHAEQWMATRKPVSLTPEEVRKLFDDEALDAVARHLAIPLESVEVQASLGIPKFFSTLAADESSDLGLDYSAKKKNTRGTNRSDRAPPP